MSEFRSGFVTLIGKPNVGKSTLLNSIVGRKISITSSKPQTTRHRILGIYTTEQCQIVFVDTPGLHRPSGRTLNRVITHTARTSMLDVDVIVLMVTYAGWDDKDRYVLDSVRNIKVPVVLTINKIDQLKNKEKLLPLIEESSQLMNFAEIIPLSAKSGDNKTALLNSLATLLPPSPMCFPEDQITDRDTRFMLSELIREQAFRLLGEEIPYALAVRIAEWSEGNPPRIEAHIWVERESQKGMVVGKDGRRIKEIGTRARRSIEQFLGKQVFLNILVKVRKGWADNQADLNSLGYVEGY
ncbi:MAG: GTPase Era [Arenicellales bacterium]|nr:GTPase Era [Arenicellales bacterium]